MMADYKPILAVTMGDPAGIGPEIAAKVFADGEVYKICRPLLIGNSEIMQAVMQFTPDGLKIHSIHQPDEAFYKPGTIDLVELTAYNLDTIRSGIVSAAAGDLAFRAVQKAIELAMEGKADGTVTCPVNKEALHAAGHYFSGHTEIYAHFTHVKKYAMLLSDDQLNVIHVSTHVSLRKACDLVRKDRIYEVISLLDNGLKSLGFSRPRIGVAGLNPHAGEKGLFGEEEMEEILPAILKARKKGILAEGPVPPDTLFALAKGGHFDGCVAMYHDQGHIPFKMNGFEWDETHGVMKSVRGVNITLGLPIIRTSVDHGTAFEITGKGKASPEALMNAISYAVKLCKNRKL
jgi:4-phospho-D-threonate 3-dehydrogenase / 4-phospho-D-erythronate 3-dehydrogenase